MFGTGWALAVAVVVQSTAAAPPPRQNPPATARQVWSDDKPVTHLFQNLFHDLKSLPSRNSAVVLAAGGAGAAATSGADTRFANWSAAAGQVDYTEVGRALGNGWIQSGGALATYGIGKLSKNAQVVHIGGDLVRAQTLNGLLTTAIKVSVNRSRPSGGHYAFPSGHTSATFASAAVLQAHYGWKAGAPAFVAGGFVAWTRARERAHWLSDVAFGSAIGLASGWTVAGRHRSRVIVVPTATRGGAALTFFIN